MICLESSFKLFSFVIAAYQTSFALFHSVARGIGAFVQNRLFIFSFIPFKAQFRDRSIVVSIVPRYNRHVTRIVKLCNSWIQSQFNIGRRLVFEHRGLLCSRGHIIHRLEASIWYQKRLGRVEIIGRCPFKGN